MTTKQTIRTLISRIQKENGTVWTADIKNETVAIRYDSYNWFSISWIQILNNQVSTKKEVERVLREYFEV